MGFLDALTGAPAHDANAANRGALLAMWPQLTNTTGTARDEAANYLKTGFSGARTDLGQGYDAATGAIKGGAGGALGYLDAGQAGATGALTNAGAAFDPLKALAGKYGAGSSLYSDALGINGPEGNTRATSAFQPSQAYQFNLDQGLEAINRRRAAGGMLASGNADRDAQVFGSGLASQEQNKWMDRLQGFMAPELAATGAAASGTAGVGRDLASLYDSGGRARAGVATGEGNSMSDLARAYYGSLAGGDTAQGGALAGNVTGAARDMNATTMNLLPQYNKTYQQDADASMAASKNSINLGLNLAALGAGAAGGMGMPSGMGGGSFGMPGGSLGLSGMGDPSMWNKSLPVNGFNWG